MNNKQEVANIEPPRLPYHKGLETKFGVDIGGWKTLTEAIFPSAKTSDAVILALNYCKSRGLDPFKRPVHIVPIWDSKKKGYIETVWPGIAELRTTAMRTKIYAGIDEAEFGPSVTVTFTGTVKQYDKQSQKMEWKEVTKKVSYPEFCIITVYKIVEGVRVAFVGPKVLWSESYGSVGASDIPNDMWAKRSFGQLEKCAEAAALRRAFPEEIGNDYAAEEMEGKKHQGPENAKVVNPETERPRRSDHTEEAHEEAKTASEEQSNDVPVYPFVDQFGEMSDEQLTIEQWIVKFSETINEIEIDAAVQALAEHNENVFMAFDEDHQDTIKKLISDKTEALQ